jgi:hypothetical protein
MMARAPMTPSLTQRASPIRAIRARSRRVRYDDGARSLECAWSWPGQFSTGWRGYLTSIVSSAEEVHLPEASLHRLHERHTSCRDSSGCFSPSPVAASSVDTGLVEAAHLGMESSCQADERERERGAAGFALQWQHV